MYMWYLSMYVVRIHVIWIFFVYALLHASMEEACAVGQQNFDTYLDFSHITLI